VFERHLHLILYQIRVRVLRQIRSKHPSLNGKKLSVSDQESRITAATGQATPEPSNSQPKSDWKVRFQKGGSFRKIFGKKDKRPQEQQEEKLVDIGYNQTEPSELPQIGTTPFQPNTELSTKKNTH